MKKQLDLTKSVLSQINNFRKNKAEQYNKDAIRLFRLGEKEAAIKDFKKALYITPKFSESFPKEEIAYSLALVYRSLEDIKKELKYYSKALFFQIPQLLFPHKFYFCSNKNNSDHNKIYNLEN